MSSGGDGFESAVACVGDGYVNGSDDVSEGSRERVLVQLVEVVECCGVDDFVEWCCGGGGVGRCVGDDS